MTKEELTNLIKDVVKDSLGIADSETVAENEFVLNGKFLFSKFGDYIIQKYNVKRLNGDLFFYYDSSYSNDIKQLESVFINEYKGMTRTRRKEVLSYIDLVVPDKHYRINANYIAFKNGIYNIRNNKFIPPTKDVISINPLIVNYNEDAYSEVVDKALDDFACGDKDVRNLLEEIVGYILYKRCELRKAFILVGGKHNGKTTYINMIRSIVGYENISNLKLKEIGDRFSTFMLSGKLLNICEEMGDVYVKNPEMLKDLITGGTVKAERKGQDAFDLINYAKFIFSANKPPQFNDKTGALFDRLVYVPFNNNFSKSSGNLDLEIIDKLTTTESREYLAQLGLKALKRVLENQCFTINGIVKETTEHYYMNNDSVTSHISGLNPAAIKGRPVKEVYENYVKYCEDEGFVPVSKINFTKEVKAIFNIDTQNKSVNGKTERCYV